MMKKILTILLLSMIFTSCAQKGDKEKSDLAVTITVTSTNPQVRQELCTDDYEINNTNWLAGKPPIYNDSSAQSVKIDDQWASSGLKSLLMEYAKYNNSRAIFYSETEQDLSTLRYLIFDLMNTGSISGVAIALSTGSDWLWHESTPIIINGETNTLSFDLQAKYYKTNNTNWLPESPISNLSNVHRIAVIFTLNSSGSTFIDCLRFSDSPLGLQVNLESLIYTPTSILLHNASYLSVQVLTPPSQVYKKTEVKILTDGIFANPFDSHEVDLNLQIISPDGEQTLIPAFWYQDFHQMGNAPTEPAEWHARFTPTISGKWKIQAVLNDLKSQLIEIDVLPSSEQVRGFIRIKPGQDRYLSFENGETFFPIGINLGWSIGEPLSDYSHWLDELSSNGCNTIRVWMASWSFGLEWNDTGLGDYTKRLSRAWQLDQIFEMAKQNNVYIELVILNHGAFSETVNAEWQSNPYNMTNGGMCEKPDCFVTDQQAKDLFKRRLRYIAARWGYSPNLLTWEWWNEADWTPIDDQQMIPWLKEMTAVVQEYDPNDHLFSTSYAQSPRPAINNLPEIDYAHLHLYASTDPILTFPNLYQQWNEAIPGKPIIFGEFGANAGGENMDAIDLQGLHLHNGLWASTFSGFASSSMYWWWDSYVDPLNLWPIYKRLSNFLIGEDLSNLYLGNFRLSNVNVPLLTLKNETHALVYIHDRNYEVGKLEQTHFLKELSEATPDPDWIYLPEPIEDLELFLRDLKDGEYIAKWYFPSEGLWLDTFTQFMVNDGVATIAVPGFQGDLAVMITLEIDDN